MKNKKKSKSVVLLLLLLILGISIGYAALTTTLNINGNTTIEKASWDIHFENLVKTTGSEVATVDASIDDTKTLIEYTVTLPKPGDYYEFTVDIVNNGTIDAMISEVLKEGLTTEQEKYISYTATYSDGVALEEKDYLKSGETQNIRVRVKYRDDISASELPTENQSLSLKFMVTYIQADETAKEKKYIQRVTMQVDDAITAGDEVKIGTEHFYVVSSNEEETVLLTKYNLNVGTNTQSEEYGKIGLQNSKALAWRSDTSSTNGGYPATVDFSKDDYWVDSVTGTLSVNYGTEYPANVYDPENYSGMPGEDNYSIAYYVLLYEKELENLGANIKDIRLLTKTEASEFVINNRTKLYETSFWLGSVDSSESNYISSVYAVGAITQNGHSWHGMLGVRPVIIVDTSDI